VANPVTATECDPVVYAKLRLPIKDFSCYKNKVIFRIYRECDMCYNLDIQREVNNGKFT